MRVQKKPAASVKKRVMKKPCGPRTEVARAQATDDAGEGLDLDDMDMELSQHLVFLEGYYGRVSALRVMAAACLFVRQCPSFIVASLVSIAAVLSIAVALEAHPHPDEGEELAARGCHMASRVPVQEMAGVDRADEVRRFQAVLLHRRYGANH